MKLLIVSFLKYLDVEKKYSPHTIISYQNDLGSLENFCLSQYEIKNITDIKHLHIRSWIVRMMSEGISATSVNRKISSCRSFFKWLIKMKHVTVNPMLKIVAPKKPKRLPPSIHDSNMKKIVEVPIVTNPIDKYNIFRNQLIFSMFYSTGMRRAELISLNLDNIDLHRNELRVVGKGNKVRSIPIIESLKKEIINYLDIRSTLEEIIDTPALFLTSKGRRIYDKLVYNIVHQQLALYTTLNKKSPHVLRHSFATHMLDNGADINAIKEILGHANLGATQIYTQNSISKLKEAYKKAHPNA